MKVVIVDDEKKEREVLETYFKNLVREIREEITIEAYGTGEELLESYDYSYDMVCLDIDLEGMNGIEVAKKIRKTDEKVVIIFVTNMAQMAIRGYEVQAWDFVLKPVNYYSFAMKVRNAFDVIRTRKSKNILLNTLTGCQKVYSDDIFYVEVVGHYLYYHTVNGTFKQKASLKSVEEKLAGLSFKRCNNCYLVNLRHVDCVSKQDLQIAGNWLKISRPKRKEFLQALANYMGGVKG